MTLGKDDGCPGQAVSSSDYPRPRSTPGDDCVGRPLQGVVASLIICRIRDGCPFPGGRPRFSSAFEFGGAAADPRKPAAGHGGGTGSPPRRDQPSIAIANNDSRQRRTNDEENSRQPLNASITSLTAWPLPEGINISSSRAG